jgi:hypothetical protein
MITILVKTINLLSQSYILRSLGSVNGGGCRLLTQSNPIRKFRFTLQSPLEVALSKFCIPGPMD